MTIILHKEQTRKSSLFFMWNISYPKASIDFFELLYKKITIIKVNNSAQGTVAQTPLIPNNLGIIIIPIIINTIPLEAATIIDANALPIDVKYPE